ncbi:MAG TPA: hypothetical protein VGG72_20385 [Bryobacteraceae bacterium]
MGTRRNAAAYYGAIFDSMQTPSVPGIGRFWVLTRITMYCVPASQFFASAI